MDIILPLVRSMTLLLTDRLTPNNRSDNDVHCYDNKYESDNNRHLNHKDDDDDDDEVLFDTVVKTYKKHCSQARAEKFSAPRGKRTEK